MTDEQLILAVAAGKVHQAALLYERYKRLMLNYYHKQGLSRDNCQDLCQQVFYRMIKYANSFRKDASFRPWIYRIAHHVHMDHIKQNPSVLNDLSEAQELADQTTVNENHEILNIALNRLPLDLKTVLIMAKYEDLKYEQIATALEISEALVKVRVHRGLKMLRTYYFEYENR